MALAGRIAGWSGSLVNPLPMAARPGCRLVAGPDALRVGVAFTGGRAVPVLATSVGGHRPQFPVGKSTAS
jgi:hypothetical protein